MLTWGCSFPLAPKNTWSNIAYVVAGALAWVLRPTAWGAVIGSLFVALGIASAWYHGTKTLTSSRADNAGIYALLTALMLHALGMPLAAPAFLIAGVVAWTFAFGPWWRHTLEPVAGVLGIVASIAAAVRGSSPLVAVSFAFFAAGFLAWEADKERRFLWPEWGHAVWHILTAIALLLLFVAAP